MFVVDDSMLGTKANSYWLLMLLRLDVKADLFGVGLPDQDISSTAILWRDPGDEFTQTTEKESTFLWFTTALPKPLSGWCCC